MKRLQELKQRAALAWRIVRDRDSNLVRHALTELQVAGHFDEDEMSALAANCAVDLVRVFSSQGHSGFSASFMRHLVHKLFAYEPLHPLTGTDGEWFDHGEDWDRGRFQNKRAGHVFKDTVDGPAYDINAVVFEEPSGARFTGRHSKQFVAFPYTPRSVVAQVPEDATDVQKAMLADQAWSRA